VEEAGILREEADKWREEAENLRWKNEELEKEVQEKNELLKKFFGGEKTIENPPEIKLT